MREVLKKFTDARGGVNRLVLIFLIAIAAVLVLIAKPLWDSFAYDAARRGCEAALKSATDGLVIDYLYHFEEGSVDDARMTLEEVMPGRENLCPAGGTVYLIRNDSGIYEPVCGLHGRDERQRTRLNASYAKKKLEEELSEIFSEKPSAAGSSEREDPDTITIGLNGSDLEIRRAEIRPALTHGTDSMVDYEGTVAFYGIDEAGDLSFFTYADENYCAAWSPAKGWTGDAYG